MVLILVDFAVIILLKISSKLPSIHLMCLEQDSAAVSPPSDLELVSLADQLVEWVANLLWMVLVHQIPSFSWKLMHVVHSHKDKICTMIDIHKSVTVNILNKFFKMHN